MYQKNGCSQKLQYKHHNGKKQTEGDGGRVKDMEFSGVKLKVDSCKKSYILERVSFEQHEEFQIMLSWCVQFPEHVAKINFLSWNFLNYSTWILTHIFSYFPHKSVIWIFLSLMFFSLISLFHLILRNDILTQRSWKGLHNLIFMIWFN